jgi:hypothetical protein
MDNSITALLTQLSEGDRDAEARLIPQIHKELRRVAGHYIKRECSMARAWLKGEFSSQP